MRCSVARGLAAIVLLACGSASGDVLEGSVTTLLHARSNPRDGDIYSVVPLYQTLQLTLRDVRLPERASPYLADVRLELQVWGAGQLTSSSDGNRIFGDVDVGYLEGKLFKRRLQVRLGRQFIAGGAIRFSHIDGAAMTARINDSLAVTVFGGVPVAPRFGVKLGDAAAGARASVRIGNDSQIGFSFAHIHDAGRSARQDIAVDFRGQFHRKVALSGLGSYSILEQRIVEIDLGATFLPIDMVGVRLDYRRQAPDLFIPRGSIFSVFAQETRDELGGSIDVRPTRRISVDGDYHVILDDAGSGHRAGARASVRLGRWADATVGAQFRLLLLPLKGYYQARAFFLWRILPTWVASLDADAYFFTANVNGHDYSLTGAATIGWDFRPSWRAVVSGAYNTTPFQVHGFEAMAKLAYSPTFRFREVHR